MAHEFNMDPTTCALNGGEDYELLFTLQTDDYKKIEDKLQSADINVIGYMSDSSEGANLITRDGTHVALTAQGWNAMQNSEES